MKLAGKKTIITGGSRGIGAAIAKLFAREGATSAIIHFDDAANAAQTMAYISEYSPASFAVSLDLSDGENVVPTLEGVIMRLGGIDILVNAAGVGLSALFEDIDIDHWQKSIQINLTGSFLVTKACYPPMKAQGSGRIINISSQKAFSGSVGAAAYCASKAGLIGLTRALALEAAPFGVLVNCIAPGATNTNMLANATGMQRAALSSVIPLGRFAEPEEIAPTALLLASADGGFYVGQTLSPNGGDVIR